MKVRLTLHQLHLDTRRTAGVTPWIVRSPPTGECAFAPVPLQRTDLTTGFTEVFDVPTEP
ncbi:hypothetical protein DFP74_2458 [Nocardiopsis sp. Huas11]|nr:hypothetical protein DFP74_2458 [Nocardiopsis sp. Huas11]